MEKKLCGLFLVVFVLCVFAPKCMAKDAVAQAIKLQERYTVSLELEFSKRNPNAMDRVINFLDWGPNGYATGFLVGDGLVMTSYHVVSGDLGEYKKLALGFAPDDLLDVKVFVRGCSAKVISVDRDADLALLEVCGSRKNVVPTYQSSLSKDEKLLLIARPHGDSILRKGTLSGSYRLNGLEYWSAKLNARDGFSGSPVYNEHAELIGVMSGYDPSKKLALISPVVRVQKLLENYSPTRK